MVRDFEDLAKMLVGGRDVVFMYRPGERRWKVFNG